MDYAQIYADFLKKHFNLLKPIKIVADSSNGPAGMVIAKLKDIPNLEIISLHDDPNPEFPAHGPNPLKDNATADAAKKVLETGADFGVIFDADADRAFFVDDTGVMLPSFMTSILLFKNSNGPYVCDELVFKSLEHSKVFSPKLLVPSKVGSFYVKQKLKEVKASEGAEFSGHYYFKEFFGADSGIFTMIKVINTLSGMDTKLSVFRKALPQHELVNDEVKLSSTTWNDIESKIHEYATAKELSIETREGITLDNGTSWINIRPSNTEPIIRLIGGTTNMTELQAWCDDLRALVS